MSAPLFSGKFWQIFLNENQSLPGRSILWCKRKNALHLTDATPAEQKELWILLKALKIALERVFAPDWFNFEALGNKVNHLHVHVVPRYRSPRWIGGVKFVDVHYGKPSHTTHKRVIALKVQRLSRKRLKAELVNELQS